MNLMSMTIPQKLIDDGYIRVQKHPTEELYIYNYSHKCQFEGLWNEHTLQCRGLILDGCPSGHVVAMPFKKFFNYQEHVAKEHLTLPTITEFNMYEKLDGSLGILYQVRGEPFIATRGSFTSDQAQVANVILKEKYSHVKFKEDYTYLFEIIYPQNRIVVDYKDTKDLYLIGMMYVNQDLPYKQVKEHAYYWNMPYAKEYDCRNKKIEEIMKIQKPNEEGYVIWIEFPNLCNDFKCIIIRSKIGE